MEEVGLRTITKLDFSDFLLGTLPINLIELLVALAGVYYLRKNPGERTIRAFVWFLWLTLAVELLSAYAAIAFFSNYELLPFLEDSPFRRNYWMFNIYLIFSALFYSWFFLQYIKSEAAKKALRYLMLFFLVSAPINLLFTDIFFVGHSRYTLLVGTLIQVSVIFVFFYELLQSNHLLHLKRYLPYYVAVGSLVFLFCTTPLQLLSRYFNLETGNGFFVKVKAIVLICSNIFMYLTFALGFIICSSKKKSY